MLPYMGLLHTALGDKHRALPAGRASASEVLEAVEAAYTSAARERGFLN